MMIDPMFVFTNKQRTEQYAEKCSDEFCAGGMTLNQCVNMDLPVGNERENKSKSLARDVYRSISHRKCSLNCIASLFLHDTHFQTWRHDSRLVFPSLPLSYLTQRRLQPRLGKIKVRSNAVLFAELGLLVLRQTSQKSIEVWDHSLVLLDNLAIISSSQFFKFGIDKLTSLNVSRISGC
jgi:hypothetical protein